jgi:hypothetical protein
MKGDGSGGSGAGGVGKGIGRGRGNGIDRGLSAAHRNVQILEMNIPLAALPLHAKAPERSCILCLTVEADGSISAVKVEQSCGVKDIDEYLQVAVRVNTHVSPEYDNNGKAVASTQEVEFTFNPSE